jgi:hypothetical protein
MKQWSALFAVIVCAMSNAQSVSKALDERGDPDELSFLKGLQFQANLAASIVYDIRNLPSAEARRSILNRMRADQASVGALPDSVLNYVLHPPASLADSLKALRQQARALAPFPDSPKLRSALPDTDVISVERLRQVQYIAGLRTCLGCCRRRAGYCATAGLEYSSWATCIGANHPTNSALLHCLVRTCHSPVFRQCVRGARCTMPPSRCANLPVFRSQEIRRGR